MRKFGIVAIILGLLATLTACRTTASATDDCLNRSNIIELADGPRGRFPGSRFATPPGSGIDARGTIWEVDNPYPVVFEDHPPNTRHDLCMVGGDISNPNPHETTTWAEWHGMSGLTVKRPDFEGLQTKITNVGDALRFTGQATNWELRGVHVTRAHDDCVENDGMNSGIVDDSFFDGCYVFYSARRPQGEGKDGGANTFTLTDSLVRLEHMPSVYNGDPNGGHGPFFKLSANPDFGRSPRMVIRDTVFRADDPSYNGSMGVPKYDHDKDPATPHLDYLAPEDCSNNTMVWLGEGPFPGNLPDCFTITTDPAVWDAAVADWWNRRP